MKRGLFLILAVIILMSACSNKKDWLKFRSNNGTGYTSNSISPPLGIKWKLDLQEDFDGDRNFNPPMLKDGTLYFGSADGNFYALDIESGFMRWVAQTSAPINSIPYVGEEMICLGSTDGYIYAVDRLTGEGLWQYFAAGRVNSTIERYDDMLIATGDNRSILFLGLDGSLIEEFPNPVWSYHSFLIDDGIFYFMPGSAINDYNMGAYDINSGEFLWFVPRMASSSWYSFPAIEDDLIYYSIGHYINEGMELFFYASDRFTGEVQWINREYTDYGLDTGETFQAYCMLLDFMAPAIYNNLVIYSCGDNILRAYNKNTGAEVWRVNFNSSISSAPTISGNRIYFGVSEGTDSASLVCLDARTGGQLWNMDTEGDVLSAPVIAGKWMVFGTSENKMYILEEVF